MALGLNGEQRRTTKIFPSTVLDRTMNVSELTSSAGANKQKKCQLSSGLCDDPRSNAHILGGKGSKERNLGFFNAYQMIRTKNLILIDFTKIKRASILSLLLQWLLPSRNSE